MSVFFWNDTWRLVWFIQPNKPFTQAQRIIASPNDWQSSFPILSEPWYWSESFPSQFFFDPGFKIYLQSPFSYAPISIHFNYKCPIHRPPSCEVKLLQLCALVCKVKSIFLTTKFPLNYASPATVIHPAGYLFGGQVIYKVFSHRVRRWCVFSRLKLVSIFSSRSSFKFRSFFCHFFNRPVLL